MNESDKVSGRKELPLNHNEKLNDKIGDFSKTIREDFRREGKRIRAIVTESITEDRERGVAIFDYIAEVVDYNFEETEEYFERYEKKVFGKQKKKEANLLKKL